MLSRSDLFAILQHRFQPRRVEVDRIAHAHMGFPYTQILICVYKITPMQSCTYKMQPIYYIAPYTDFLIATKVNQCYGGNAKRIAGGWLGGPGRDLAARRADLVSSGGGGRRGPVVISFWAWLGRGPAMCEAVWVGVHGGEQFARAAFGGRGGWAWVFWRVPGGRVRATGEGGRAVGRGAPLGGCVRVAECGDW